MPLLLSPAPSSTTPSPALLDFLAQLSPPPSPDSPPAPAFLCPACTKPEISSARRRRRERSTSAFTNPAVTPAEQRPKQHSDSSHRFSPQFKTSNNQYQTVDFSVIAAVPPKYEQSSDGFWYIATSWSLHGKTSQPNLFSSPTPTPSSGSSFPPSNVVVATQLPDRDDDDNDADDLNSSLTYNDTVVSTIASDYDAIKDSLPTGWTITPHRTPYYNYEVIIVVSLILAILLSLIIAGCVLGHKARSGSRSQSLKKILIEAKARANAQKNLSRTSSRLDVEVDTEGGDPDLEILSDSERAEKILKVIRRKEKLWDKWRNRSSKLSDLGLRRRKKKTTTVVSTVETPAEQAIVTVDEVVPPIPTITVPGEFPPTELANATSSSSLRHVNTASTSTLSAWSGPTTSSQPSPRLGASLPNPSSSLEPPTSLNPSTSVTSSLLPLPFLPIAHRHPPAYHRGAAVNDQRASPSITQVDRIVTKSDDQQDDYHVISSGSYFLDQDQETRHGLDEYPHPEYSPPPSLSPVTLPLRAHIATDDKAVLEKMRRGGSEPLDAAVTSTSTLAPEATQSEPLHPNAPVWVDESIKDLEDVPHRDGDVKTSTSHNLSTQLPPLPSADFHRHLERHYNAEVLFPLEGRSMMYQPLSFSSLDSPSSSNLQPSAPPVEDVGEGPSNLSIPLTPSAPLLANEDEDEQVDDEIEESGDDQSERRSRWDREVEMEASLARTRSTPSIAAATAIDGGSHYSRWQRRRSLSVSSTINGSSNPSKRISLPRYEP